MSLASELLTMSDRLTGTVPMTKCLPMRGGATVPVALTAVDLRLLAARCCLLPRSRIGARFTECAGQLDEIRKVVRRSHALLPGVGTMLSRCRQKRRTDSSSDGVSNPASALRCNTDSMSASSDRLPTATA